MNGWQEALAEAGPISHDEAEEMLSRYNASHFRSDKPRARYSIPRNPRYDDDIRMSAYIEQQREKDAELTRLREENATLNAELLRVRTTGHGAAHELDNIAVESGLGHSPKPGEVAEYVRRLRAIEAAAKAAGLIDEHGKVRKWCGEPVFMGSGEIMGHNGICWFPAHDRRSRIPRKRFNDCKWIERCFTDPKQAAEYWNEYERKREAARKGHGSTEAFVAAIKEAHMQGFVTVDEGLAAIERFKADKQAAEAARKGQA